MAKPEQCGHCNKPATIHLTQIINNKIHKVDLCEDCPFKKGVTDPEGFSLADFLLKPPALLSMESALQCPDCGLTPADFKKTGRLGCPQCYSTFKDVLKPMLANMHKDTLHRGKVPATALSRIHLQRQLQDLEVALADAIRGEFYEQAAEIRDQIRDLKQQTTDVEDS